MTKKTPTSFVATCQCGVVVGAMDYRRMDSKLAGQILGKWLHDGCTVEPHFSDILLARVERCRCKQVEPDKLKLAIQESGWVDFAVAQPQGPNLVQQYLGGSVLDPDDPPNWAFPTSRWDGAKDAMATHWRYIDIPKPSK